MGEPVKPLPYWQVNVPEDMRVEECPEYLRNLKARDQKIISTPDAEYQTMTWEDVQIEVKANRIDHLRRLPSDLRRYLAFTWQIKQEYGAVSKFLLEKRLGWRLPLKPQGLRFACADNIKILYNDWPYGIDSRIVHLLVWTKFVLEEDTETGDLTIDERNEIEEYVNKTFRTRVPKDQVRSARTVSAVDTFLLTNASSLGPVV